MNVHDARSRLWLRLKLLVLSASVLFLAGCASSEKWGWYVISPTTKQGRINIEFLLSGVGWTVALTVCCVLLSIALGFVLYLPACLLYTSPSPRDQRGSRMPSSA